MKHPLKQVLDDIQFVNKDKYELDIDFHDFRWRHFTLCVNRKLICSLDGTEKIIGNPSILEKDITTDELVKIVFERVGQFEAHEFCESFKYSGVHAFFPHDTDWDKHVTFLYGKSNKINRLIMDPWKWIRKDETHWNIMEHYLNAWYEETTYYKTCVKLEKNTKLAYSKSLQWFFKKRNLLTTRLKIAKFHFDAALLKHIVLNWEYLKLLL